MSVKLTEQVPAFCIDDDAFERLWRGVEAKWAGEEPAMNMVTVRAPRGRPRPTSPREPRRTVPPSAQ